MRMVQELVALLVEGPFLPCRRLETVMMGGLTSSAQQAGRRPGDARGEDYVVPVPYHTVQYGTVLLGSYR